MTHVIDALRDEGTLELSRDVTYSTQVTPGLVTVLFISIYTPLSSGVIGNYYQPTAKERFFCRRGEIVNTVFTKGRGTGSRRGSRVIDEVWVRVHSYIHTCMQTCLIARTYTQIYRYTH